MSDRDRVSVQKVQKVEARCHSIDKLSICMYDRGLKVIRVVGGSSSTVVL